MNRSFDHADALSDERSLSVPYSADSQKSESGLSVLSELVSVSESLEDVTYVPCTNRSEQVRSRKTIPGDSVHTSLPESLERLKVSDTHLRVTRPAVSLLDVRTQFFESSSTETSQDGGAMFARGWARMGTRPKRFTKRGKRDGKTPEDDKRSSGDGNGTRQPPSFEPTRFRFNSENVYRENQRDIVGSDK